MRSHRGPPLPRLLPPRHPACPQPRAPNPDTSPGTPVSAPRALGARSRRRAEDLSPPPPRPAAPPAGTNFPPPAKGEGDAGEDRAAGPLRPPEGDRRSPLRSPLAAPVPITVSPLADPFSPQTGLQPPPPPGSSARRLPPAPSPGRSVTGQDGRPPRPATAQGADNPLTI